MPPVLPGSPLHLTLSACGARPQNVRQLLTTIHAQQRRAAQRLLRETELWALLSTLEFYGHVEHLPRGGWVRRPEEPAAALPVRPALPASPATPVRRRVPSPRPQEPAYA